MLDLEKQGLEAMESILSRSTILDPSEVEDLFYDCVDTEIKFFKWSESFFIFSVHCQCLSHLLETEIHSDEFCSHFCVSNYIKCYVYFFGTDMKTSPLL